jgi:hypothetical protein
MTKQDLIMAINFEESIANLEKTPDASIEAAAKELAKLISTCDNKHSMRVACMNAVKMLAHACGEFPMDSLNEELNKDEIGAINTLSQSAEGY